MTTKITAKKATKMIDVLEGVEQILKSGRPRKMPLKDERLDAIDLYGRPIKRVTRNTNLALIFKASLPAAFKLAAAEYGYGYSIRRAAEDIFVGCTMYWGGGVEDIDILEPDTRELIRTARAARSYLTKRYA